MKAKATIFHSPEGWYAITCLSCQTAFQRLNYPTGLTFCPQCDCEIAF